MKRHTWRFIQYSYVSRAGKHPLADLLCCEVSLAMLLLLLRLCAVKLLPLLP
jgi:hypothetical protein